VLSWIPIIGGLFRTTHNSDIQSELYLFLTPHIISSDTDIDRLRDAVHKESELLQKVPLQHRIPSRSADTVSTSQLPSVQVPERATPSDTWRPMPSVQPRPVAPADSSTVSPSESRPWRRDRPRPLTPSDSSSTPAPADVPRREMPSPPSGPVEGSAP
jgi:hypothetical protein